MEWYGPRPHDATEQLVEFATTGRLRTIERSMSRRARRSPTSFLLLAVAVACALGGLVIAVAATVSGAGATVVAVGALTAVAGAALCVPAVRILQDRHLRPLAIEPEPGAVLPVELLKVGHWVRRDGGWSHVVEIGHNGLPGVTALLSSGAVVNLTGTVMVAGGPFQPVKDPVAELRH